MASLASALDNKTHKVINTITQTRQSGVRTDQQHLAMVESVVALGDMGLRLVPVAWLRTDSGYSVACCTSRPVAGEVDVQGAA